MAYASGINLDPTRDTPLYEQVFDQYVARIQSGTLPAGYRLPPTRQLATELGTHRNTIVRAFEELVAAGFVTSIVGRGTFVADTAPAADVRVEPPRRAELPWSSLVSTHLQSGPITRFDCLPRSAGGGDRINLQSMQPAPELLPLAQFQRVVSHVLRTEGRRALGYAPRDGLPRLRQTIADELGRQGLPARADELIITSGSQQALDLVARALISPGDTFLVEEPTYPGAINLLSAQGARLAGVACDDEGPSLAALERLAGPRTKGLYVMPAGRNPTGSTISPRRREALVRWSHRAGVPIIEDHYVADLELDGEPSPPPLRALDPEVIYMGTFSKKLIPALRIGFLVVPPALRGHLVRLKHALDLGTSLFMQHVLAELLERGYLRAHLRRTLPEYRARRDALATALRAHLPREVTWTLPRTGFSLWLQLPPELHPEAVFHEADRRGVLVTPGTLSSVGGFERPGLRLTFCSEPPRRLAEGAERLAKAIEAVARARPSPQPGHEKVALGVV